MIKRFLLGLAAAAGLAAGAPGPARAAGELNLYDWFDYIPQALLDRFGKENDVKVNLDTFDSNETLLARLKGGVPASDGAGRPRPFGDPPRNESPEQLRARNKLPQDSHKSCLSFNSDGSKEVLVSGD